MKPASQVQSFDPLCEVQSDKASVEITSPFDGTVKEILVKEGDIAKVGSDLCLIEVEEDQLDDSEEAQKSGSTPEIPKAVKPNEAKQPEPAEEPHPKESERHSHPLDPRAKKQTLGSEPPDCLALPSVRHFAKEQGVDLTLLTPGSGRGGRIEKRDVDAYLSRASSPAPAHKQVTATRAEEDVVVELGRTRYGMWKAMVKVRR